MNRKTKKSLRRILFGLFVVFFLLFAVSGLDPLGMFGRAPVATPTPVDQGGSWEIYFTDPHLFGDPAHITGSIEETLIARINAAQSSIHIAAFEFNLPLVAEALIAAAGRGVEVRWVTDDENGLEADFEPGRGQFELLMNAGIPVRDDGRSALMHDKFIVFDHRIVWTGSTNLTENDIFRNNNNVIVVESTDLAAAYELEFAEMWDGEFGITSPSTIDRQTAQVDEIPIEALFAAEDGVVDRIIPLVQQARTSVIFMAFSFTHDALGEAMLERASAVLDVRGIFETRGSETEFSEMGRLFCAGVPVRRDGNPATFHHKVIVIDGLIVVTGSLNFSDNANDSNDENVLIIQSSRIAARYLQEFNKRWLEAQPPEPDC